MLRAMTGSPAESDADADAGRAPYGPVCDTPVDAGRDGALVGRADVPPLALRARRGAAAAARRAHRGDDGRQRVGRAGAVLPPRRAAAACRRCRGCRASPRRTCAPTCAARTARAGIWFFSLDAARLGAVVTARATYRIPYFWSRDVDRARRVDDHLPVPAALAGTSRRTERRRDRHRRAVPTARADRARPLPHRPLVAVQRATVRAPPRAGASTIRGRCTEPGWSTWHDELVARRRPARARSASRSSTTRHRSRCGSAGRRGSRPEIDGLAHVKTS